MPSLANRTAPPPRLWREGRTGLELAAPGARSALPPPRPATPGGGPSGAARARLPGRRRALGRARRAGCGAAATGQGRGHARSTPDCFEPMRSTRSRSAPRRWRGDAGGAWRSSARAAGARWAARWPLAGPDLVAGVVAHGLAAASTRSRSTRWPCFQVRFVGALGEPRRTAACSAGTASRASAAPSCAARPSGRFPAGVGFVSIYSRSDGIVDWHACLDPAAEHVEVAASHIGMAVNADAYAAVGAALEASTPSTARAVRPPVAVPPDSAASGVALEQRHALDVRRLREHVDRAHAAQRVAGLDELGGVRRERRRVAGDVDDPPRRGLDDPADDLLREPGARRVDDDDVGAPGALDQLAQRERARRRRRSCALLDLVAARAFVDRVGDRRLDQLQPPQLRRARRQRQADRADAAVEVEDALAAPQRRRTRRRARTGARPSRCWSGRTPAGEIRKRRLAELLLEARRSRRSARVSPPRGRLAERRRPAVHSRPSQSTAPARAVGVERPGRGDEPHLDLAGAPPLAHDEVAQEALVRAAVLGGQALGAAPVEHLLAHARSPRSEASRQSSTGSMRSQRPGRVEAAHQLAVAVGAERVLELVAVAPLLDGRHDRLEREAVEPADPPQRVVDLLPP